ncbi:hypothetical protein Emed_007312 [Eimeria media]
MATSSLGEGGGLSARPLLIGGSEGAPLLLKPSEADHGGPRRVRVFSPGAPTTQQRPAGGGPPRGEGHLSHLLYSIALARNDKSRIAALLTLESNCLSLLPDTQKLHVAFTALDAIVCNAVPFTLKTGGPRKSPYSRAHSEGPSARAPPRGAKGWFRGAPSAGGGPPSAEGPPSTTSPNSRNEANAQGPQEDASKDATQDSAEAAAPASAAAEGAVEEQQQQMGVGADSLGGPSVGSPPPGGPQHPAGGPLPLSSESAASSTSGPEAVFSFPASPQGRYSSATSSGLQNAASGASPSGAHPASKGSNRGSSPQPSCWLAVTRPFSVLSRVAAMQVWTSISVLLDCLLVAPRWLERLVGLLHAFVRKVGAPEDACIRAYACSCLEELEMAYPGLLLPLIGPEGFSSPQGAATFGTLQLGPLGAPGGPQGLHSACPLFLKDLLEKETKETHFAAEAYASLLLRCCRHLAESVICEVEVAKKNLQGALEGPQGAPPVSFVSDVEATETERSTLQRRQPQVKATGESQRSVGEALATRPGGAADEGPFESLASFCLRTTETAALHYKIPFIGVSAVPLPAVTLTGSSSGRGNFSSSSGRQEGYPPPRLVRGLGMYLRTALSLTLERIWKLGDWAQLTVGGQLAFFTRLLCLPASASAALMLPFLFSSRMHLIHSWALLVEAAGDEGGGPLGGPPVSQLPGPYALLLSERLQELAQDQTLGPYKRTLAIRWLMALMQHPKFAASFSNTPPSVFCPSAEDHPSVKEHLIQALLLYSSTSSRSSSSGGNSSDSRRTCDNLYDVCGVMYEFVCARRAPEVHAVVFRLLLRSMQRPQLANRQLRDFLCEHLRCRPVELGPSVLLLLHHAAQSVAALPLSSRGEQASGGRCERVEIIECLLLPLAEFLEGVEPPEDLLLFSALIFRLSTEPLLPSSCLLGVLRRLANTSAAADAAHSWRAGLCVLAVAKQLLLTHRVCSEVREGLSFLLGGLAKSSDDLDLREGASVLLKIITHASPSAIFSLLSSTGDDAGPLVERYLSHVSPPQYFRASRAAAAGGAALLLRFEATVPFLSFSKSRRQRRVLCGLEDQQAAFFLTPKNPTQEHKGGPPPDDEPQEQVDVTPCFQAVYQAVHGEAAIEALAYGGAPPETAGSLGVNLSGPLALCLSSSAVDAYYAFVAAHSFSICLPFRLRVTGPPKGGPCFTSGPQGAPRPPLREGPPYTTEAPSQGTSWVGDLYAIELSFSQCPSYRPLRNVLIPFLQSSIQDALGNVGDALSEEEEAVVTQAADSAFPFNYEIILNTTAAARGACSSFRADVTAAAAAAVHVTSAAFAADKMPSGAAAAAAVAAVRRPGRMPVALQQQQQQETPCAQSLSNSRSNSSSSSKMLEPLEPVPASLRVGVRFSDANGAAYSGSLESFTVSFQDLFLPVCAPPEFRAVLFESIWKRTDTARSVKTLDLEPENVKQMVEMSLKPFLIEGAVHIEPEAFDFYRDQCLHEPGEGPSATEGAPQSLSFAVGASVSPSAAANRAADETSGGSVPVHAAWAEEKREDEMGEQTLTDVFADDYFDGQIPYSEILAGCTDTPRALMNEGTPLAGTPLHLETLHAIVFLPPKYHLLLKFTISLRTTIVRIVTDRPELLAYLDAFFAACYAITFTPKPPTEETYG